MEQRNREEIDIDKVIEAHLSPVSTAYKSKNFVGTSSGLLDAAVQRGGDWVGFCRAFGGKRNV